jgi:DNA modification methylase
MSVHYEGHGVTVHHGDALDVLRTIPDASVDSVVTDPPYGLSFMGKEWDKPTPRAELAACVECGNDDPTEGWLVCSDCLETLGDEAPRRRAGRGHGGRDMLGHVSANWHDKGTHSRGYADNDNAAFQAWCQQWAAECLRVLKPGGHLLAFGGTRTWHRLACAVEDAGFEVRDSIAWLYGSGFPKSLDVSKAIDSRAKVNDETKRRIALVAEVIRTHREAKGMERAAVSLAVVGTPSGACWNWEHQQLPSVEMWPAIKATLDIGDEFDGLIEGDRAQFIAAERAVIGTRTTGIGTGKGSVAYIADSDNRDVTAPATDAARKWAGFGTALKPAFEPVVVARKPLAGTVAANVLAHGTGALNIDGCRVAADWDTDPNRRGWQGGNSAEGASATVDFGTTGARTSQPRSGRWPANVILDEHQAAALDEQSGTLTSGKMKPTHTTADRQVFGQNAAGGYTTMETYGDSGGASRFFKVAEFDHRDEDPLEECPDCLDEIAAMRGDIGDHCPLPVDDLDARFRYHAKAPKRERPVVDGTAHPTVKPLALMRWLVRLVTPPGGTVLEPFAGSGTTVEACIVEGFQCVAIEKGDEYLPLILERIARQGRARIEAEVVRKVDPEQEVAEFDAYIRDSLFNITGEETA